MEEKKHIPVLVRYFYGEDWLVQAEIRKEIDKTLPAAARDFNLEVLDAETLTVENFWRSVQSLPMGGAHRVVWIQRADRLKGDLLEEVADYAESPLSSTSLFLSGEKPDLRLRFFQSLRRKQGLVELSSLKGGEVVVWVLRQAEKLGKKMDREAAQFLVEEVGEDLRLLQSELEKIALFVQNRSQIEKKDVEVLVASIPQESIFALIDSVAVRDRAQVFKISEEVLDQGTHPLQILNLMERQFRLLFKARELKSHSVPKAQWAAELRVPPFVVSKLEEQLRGLEEGFPERALSLCFDADFKMKSSRLPSKLILEHLFLELGARQL